MKITDLFEYIDEIKKFTPQFKNDSDISDLEPYYRQQSQKVVNLIGQSTYDAIITYLATPEPVVAIMATAGDYLKGSIANLMAIPYFIFEASERNNTDNNLYRYQENQQIETYLELAWSNLDLLLNHLESNITTFTEFATTDTYKLRSALYIKNSTEFKRYYGAVNSSYFFNNTIYLHEEIQRDEIQSRIPNFPDVTGDDLKWYIGKAMVYMVLSKACIQLDYTELPKCIRVDIAKELSNKKAQESDIKNTLANVFEIEGQKFLIKIEQEVNKITNSGVYVPSTNLLLESDKFYMP